MVRCGPSGLRGFGQPPDGRPLRDQSPAGLPSESGAKVSARTTVSYTCRHEWQAQLSISTTWS